MIKESLLAGKPIMQTFNLVHLQNGFLYINHNSGHWIITKNNRSITYNKINNFKSISKLLNSHLIQPQEFMSLWKSGLLLIDDNSYRSRKQLNCLKKEMLYVLRLTSECNLKCKYCYAAIENKPQTVSYDIATKLFQSASEYADKATILFHGGEPLAKFNKLQSLVSIGNDIAAKNKSIFRYKIQSNGTLINKKIASYLKSENIAIGISLDGITDNQNKNRLLKSGKHTTSLALKGINELIKQEIPVNLNIVVSSANVYKLGALVREFTSLGIKEFFFSPVFPAGRAQADYADYVITSEMYFQAMKDVLKEIVNLHQLGIYVFAKNISYLLLNMVSDQYYYMCQRAPCGAGNNVLSIDTNGEVYICDDFTGVSEFYCGNLQYESITEIKNKLKLNKLTKRIPDNIKSCKSCTWKSICCGGCMSGVYFCEGTIEEKSPWCSYYKEIIPYLYELIADALDPYSLIPDSFKKQ